MQGFQVQFDSFKKANEVFKNAEDDKKAAAVLAETTRRAKLGTDFTAAKAAYTTAKAMFDTQVATFEAAKNDASMTSDSPQYITIKAAMTAAEDTMRGFKNSFDGLSKEKQEQDAVDYEIQQREARATADATAETLRVTKATAMTSALTALNIAEAAKTAKEAAIVI